MDRITGQTTIDIGGGRRGFRGRNAAAGQSGTVVKADWLNPMQEEIMAVIEAAGLAPDESDWTQLYQAIQIVSVMKSGFVPVLGFAADEPAGTPLGATYVVSANPNGAFAGKAHQIAIRFTSRWIFLSAQPHTIAVSTAAGNYWRRTADGWEEWFSSPAEILSATIATKVISPSALAPAVQSSTWNYAVAGGTVNALTVTLNPVPVLLPYSLIVKFTATNTGATTIKVNSLAAVPIVRYGGAALQQGDIVNGGVGHLVLNDAGQYQLISIPSATGGVLPFLAGTTTFTVPAGVYLIKRLTSWGSGAGGGGSWGSNAGGSGGGAGAMGERRNIPVTPGQVIPITVAKGGVAGGGEPSDGQNGSATSFGNFLTVEGGKGGTRGSSSGAITAGAGGAQPNGADVARAGSGGGLPINLGNGVLLGGEGGPCPFGGGIPSPNANAAGNAGLWPGGGGSGGSLGFGGGNGADGYMEVEY